VVAKKGGLGEIFLSPVRLVGDWGAGKVQVIRGIKTWFTREVPGGAEKVSTMGRRSVGRERRRQSVGGFAER